MFLKQTLIKSNKGINKEMFTAAKHMLKTISQLDGQQRLRTKLGRAANIKNYFYSPINFFKKKNSPPNYYFFGLMK